MRIFKKDWLYKLARLIEVDLYEEEQVEEVEKELYELSSLSSSQGSLTSEHFLQLSF